MDRKDISNGVRDGLLFAGIVFLFAVLFWGVAWLVSAHVISKPPGTSALG